MTTGTSVDIFFATKNELVDVKKNSLSLELEIYDGPPEVAHQIS